MKYRKIKREYDLTSPDFVIQAKVLFWWMDIVSFHNEESCDSWFRDISSKKVRETELK